MGISLDLNMFVFLTFASVIIVSALSITFYRAKYRSQRDLIKEKSIVPNQRIPSVSPVLASIIYRQRLDAAAVLAGFAELRSLGQIGINLAGEPDNVIIPRQKATLSPDLAIQLQIMGDFPFETIPWKLLGNSRRWSDWERTVRELATQKYVAKFVDVSGVTKFTQALTCFLPFLGCAIIALCTVPFLLLLAVLPSYLFAAVVNGIILSIFSTVFYFLLGMALISAYKALRWRSYSNAFFYFAASLIPGTYIVLFFTNFLIPTILQYGTHPLVLLSQSIALIIVVPVLVRYFYYNFFIYLTSAGVEMYRELQGYHMFAHHTERYRIERAKSVPELVEYYHHFAYAIAVGVYPKWFYDSARDLQSSGVFQQYIVA